MASMIVASAKPVVSLPPAIAPLRPKLSRFPQLTLPKLPVLKSITGPVLTVSSLSMALTLAPPSLAAEIEKAALFDFNLTLPIMMAEFVFLMVVLDKIYFTPLGKFMDERDTAIKSKLGSVQDASAEVKKLDEQADAVMRAARAEIAAALNKMKKDTQEDLELKLAERGRKLEAELREALAALELQKEETIKSLDSQIAALSDEIVKKVLPGGVEQTSY